MLLRAVNVHVSAADEKNLRACLSRQVVETLQRNYHLLDRALEAFATEMRAQGVWQHVTLQSASEFGRTLAVRNHASKRDLCR